MKNDLKKVIAVLSYVTFFYFAVVAGTLDLYGNEGDFFVMLLRPFLTSIITTTCCLDTCPSQVNTFQSLSVILPQPSKSIHNNVFLDALDDWQYPPDSQCGRKFSNAPSVGTPFTEDFTIDEDGNAIMSWYCAGVRVSSPRSVLNLKSFLVFSVDLLSRGGRLKLSNTPLSISLFGKRFELYGATLWNGGHYICIFYFKNNWYMYDGLKEYSKKGSGIQCSPAMFQEPLGFSLSFLVFCR